MPCDFDLLTKAVRFLLRHACTTGWIAQPGGGLLLACSVAGTCRSRAVLKGGEEEKTS